jgi:DNA-binding XRE family transcriptional regulator
MLGLPHVRYQLSNSIHAHGRVAFPLSGVPLTFQWVRPKPYPETPETLGGHLLKRRTLAELTQDEVARAVGVNTWTYLLWETGKTTPSVRYFPAIFRFLGYDPFPWATSLPEQIAAKRRELGLSIKEAAKRIGVDEGTLGRWESGEWKPRLSQNVVARFLALSR